MEWQDVGGAIEKWIRRAARKAATALEASSGGNGRAREIGVQAMGAGSGVGDLIELVDSFEIGDGAGEGDGVVGVGEGSGGSSALAVGGEGGGGIRGRSRGRAGSKGVKGD